MWEVRTQQGELQSASEIKDKLKQNVEMTVLILKSHKIFTTQK